MIHLQLTEKDWQMAKQYWTKLVSIGKSNGCEKEATFLQKCIFDQNVVNDVNVTSIVNVPSVDTMSILMDEIENDTKINDDNNNLNLTDNVKSFIKTPVCCTVK